MALYQSSTDPIDLTVAPLSSLSVSLSSSEKSRASAGSHGISDQVATTGRSVPATQKP